MTGRFVAAAAGVVIAVATVACTGKDPSPSAGTSSRPPTRSVSTATASSGASPDSTGARILAAESAGRISASQAAMYRVFAVHGDPRLPAALSGADLGLGATQVMAAANETYADIATPKPTRAAIRPYLIPPAYEGSWAIEGGRLVPGPSLPPPPPPADVDKPLCSTLSTGNWRYVEGASSPVRVWWHSAYPARAGYATEVRDEMDRILWKKVTDYFGHAPLTDDRMCSLGGKRLDIYLVTVAGGIDGATKGIGPRDCRRGSRVFIELSVNQRSGTNGKAKLLSTAAHELTHAVIAAARQGGSDCFNEYSWLDEASARWVEQWVYPAVDGEKDNDGGSAGAALFRSPSDPLDLADYNHSANSWVYLLYLQHTIGEGVVRSIWDNAATSASSVSAVNAAAPFATVWPGFARALWNQAPVTDFQQWDHLAYTPTLALDKTITSTAQTITLDTAVPQRATRYYRLVFAGSQRTSVTVVNGLSQTSNASVQLLAKMNGSWSDAQEVGERVTFCHPPLDELIVIIANTWDRPGANVLPTPSATTIEVGDEQRCSRWMGKVTSTRTWTAQSASSRPGGKDTESLTETVRYTGTVGDGEQQIREGEEFVPPDSSGVGVRHGPIYILPVTWQAQLNHQYDAASHTEGTGQCRPSSPEVGKSVSDSEAHETAGDAWSDPTGTVEFWLSTEAQWLRIRTTSPGHEFVLTHRDRTISSSTCSGSTPSDTGWNESTDTRYAPGPEDTVPLQKQGLDSDNQAGSVTVTKTEPAGTVVTTVTWDLHRVSR